MTNEQKKNKEQEILGKSNIYNLLRYRINIPEENDFSISSVDGINAQAKLLYHQGGLTQEERMIRDKRYSLQKALLYSYQGALVKKIDGMENPVVRALINPNKLNQDYDDKIISTEFENNFKSGDIFEWVGTDTKWLIYNQELTELAYFRGGIRRCTYEISWKDESGIKSTYAAIRGPAETQLNPMYKHNLSIDQPNYSLHILMPLTEAAKSKFVRYTKFYLKGDKTCWQVSAVDYISQPGILEINAIENFSNETTDDIENGIVDGLIAEPINPNPQIVESKIQGETFIKPKKTYLYIYTGNENGNWQVTKNTPIDYVIDTTNGKKIQIKWTKSYSGQFVLKFGNYSKTIVVESLF